MKRSTIVTFVIIGLIAGFTATGCKKNPVRPTPLPGQGATPVENTGPGTTPIDSGTGLRTPGTGVTPVNVDNMGTPGTKIGDAGTPLPGGSIEGRPQDREVYKQYTVHFDFDRSVIKSSETSKIDAVASQFKTAAAGTDLLVEGHCDERGTPEYNRSLGERRALAIREYLIRAGVNAEKIHTISFGEDKPVAFGHDDSAWSQNRRGEFILVLPK